MDSTNTLPQIQTAQAQKEVTANGLFAAASPATIFGRHAEASLGLVWGYLGGRWGGTSVPNGTLNLPATSTVYLVVELASGAVSIDTSSPSLWNEPEYGRLYRVVTSAAGVLSWEDHRAGPHGVFGAGSGSGGGGGGGVTDGDKGDIEVTAGGTSWVVQEEAIDYPKIQHVSATKRVLGRVSSGSGQVEEVTATQLLDFVGSAEQGDILYRGATDWVLLPAGTSGHFLKTQGAAANPVWAAASGGSLTRFTEALSTASPNTSVPVASLTATDSVTNVDAAFAPKGAGATTNQVADGTSAGGNKRGAGAVDFQRTRTAAARVASGTNAGILCGQENTASGDNAAVAGGSANTASAQHAANLGGSSNTASGQASATVAASGCTVSGTNGFAHGNGGQDRGILNTRVHGGTAALGPGKSQRQEMVLTRTLNGSTAAVLTVGDTSPDTTNQLVLIDNSTFVVKGMVTMRQNSNGDSKCWTFEAAIKRGGSAGTTAMVAACTPVVVAADAGASGWALTVDADTTNGCLRVTGQGTASAGTYYYVCAVLDSAQIGS